MNSNHIPIGWREIKKGETIEYGDLYNVNWKNKQEKAIWRAYANIIGQRFCGQMDSIRRNNPSAIYPSGVDIGMINKLLTPKQRVKKYLQKQLDTNKSK